MVEKEVRDVPVVDFRQLTGFSIDNQKSAINNIKPTHCAV
jgi:hypothetical protein